MNRIATFAAVLLAVAVRVLPAAAAPIGEIAFEQQGAEKLTREQLDYNIRLRPGAEYRREEVDDEIKRLYGTGFFSDVSTRTEGMADGRVRLVFRLELKPLLSRVRFEGNAKFKTADLEKLVTVEPGLPVDDKKLRDSLNEVRKFYRDKGYSEATVSPELIRGDDGRVELVLQIREHLRLRVNDVDFEGAAVFSAGELRDAIANRYSWIGGLPWIGRYLNQGLFNRSELEYDQARLRDRYLEKGYLDFKVEDIAITPDPADPELVNLTFKVFEGEPYTVDKVTLSGNTVLSTPELEKHLRLRADEPFDLCAEEASRKAINDDYESRGYADVTVRPVRHADFENHRVDIDFEIVEGRRYSVRNVNISGNVYTKDKVIRRELAIQPGDPVDRGRIDVSRERLLGMGYFTKVETNAVNADAIDEKDVDIRVEEKEDRFNVKVGAGFSDVNSLVGMAEISSNNFDLFNPGGWFYGGGQRFRVQGLFGIERAGFNVDFTEPWLFDLPLRLDVSGYGNEMQYEEWNEMRYGFRTALTRKLFDDFTSVTAAYKFENVRVFDMSRHAGADLREERGSQWVSQTSVMLDRDTRDSLMFPSSGYNLNLLAAVSPKLMGSTTNFYRLELKGSYYHSFFDKAIIAMLGFRIGTVSNFDRDENAPLFERYFLGGGDSLRGFPYREVSPVNSSGKNVGGQSMMLGTVEISHPIWRFIRGAAFLDVGNAWRYSYNFSLSDLNVGAGYGLRIKIPMFNAPLKLDLAYPIVNKQDHVSSKVRFHFNMGFTF